jgi:hypothetical protein
LVSGPLTTGGGASERDLGTLRSHVTEQALNVHRHLEALRPFTRAEFGDHAAAPTEGHVHAVNELLSTLRRPLHKLAGEVASAARTAALSPRRDHLEHLLVTKNRAHDWVRATEKVWDFYFELFGQRQGVYADWLLSCDRIALDCYQHAFLGVGVARSIPAPPPFCYMRTGFSPATYRRGIPLRKLGRQLNPFPLIQLPYHRLVNPWTLGAILHEVSHNLQNDLDLQRAVPVTIGRRLLEAGVPMDVTKIWVRWNREIFGDMCGLLFGGEAFVGSLYDVIARAPEVTLSYHDNGPHPTPYVRAFLSVELLRRMGFDDAARRYHRLWRRLYPSTRGTTIPPRLLKTLDTAVPTVVESVCYQPYRSLGNKTLASVLRFQPKEQAMVEEAAERLAKGTDPGVVPARFLIGAVRVGLERRLAPASVLMKNFYDELARR